MCHEVCHKAQILETSVRSLRLVHCFHQPVTRRRILPVKWIDRMRGKAATGIVRASLGGKKTCIYLCRPFQQRLKERGTFNGGIAQLARALAWHARGPGFESPYLHQQPATGSGFWLRSTMDSAWVSGTQNLGSIPSGATFSFNPDSLRIGVFLV